MVSQFTVSFNLHNIDSTAENMDENRNNINVNLFGNSKDVILH